MTVIVGSPTVQKLTEEESWQTANFNLLNTTWNAEDQIMNSFFWNNTLNGSTINDISIGFASDAEFIQKDRDYFMHPPGATGGKAIYTKRQGGEESFSATGPNAYYPYSPYTYPHPLRTADIAPQVPKNLHIAN